MAKRIAYLDVTKCVAIYLVCLGHMHPTYRHVIYSFHMPLFMLISGYFSGNSLRAPFLMFIKKKASNLLVPAIIVGLLSFLVYYLFYGYNGHFFLLEMYGGAWFLKCLFLCYVVAWLFLKIIKNIYFAIIVSSLLVFVIPLCHTFNLNFLLLFFWTGYVFRETGFFERINAFYFVVLPIFLYLLYFNLDIVRSYQVIYPSTLFHNPLLLPTQYLVGLTGALFVVGLCKLCGKAFILVDWMKNVGKYTLGIYVFQILLLERVLQYAILEKLTEGEFLLNYILRPLIALLVMTVCYYFILYLKRYRYVNYLLFGGIY